MGLYKDKREGMIAGYRVVLLPTLIVFIFFLFARRIAGYHIDNLLEEEAIGKEKSPNFEHILELGHLGDVKKRARTPQPR